MSLGLTVMDVLRYCLTRSKNGLPLGMLAAQNGFADLAYFISPEFRHGSRGLSTRWQKWLLPIYLIAIGIIMVLVGPSTAVLIIPSPRNDWPAGSATFNIVGDASTLYPTTLSDTSNMASECISPSEPDIAAPSAKFLGCPWAGYPILSSIYSEWASSWNGYQNNPINFYEFGLIRQTVQHRRAAQFSSESWALSTPLGPSIWSANIDNAWNTAVLRLPGRYTLSSFSNYKWSMTAKNNRVPGKLPTVRTVCHYESVVDNSTSLQVFKTHSPISYLLLTEILVSLARAF